MAVIPTEPVDPIPNRTGPQAALEQVWARSVKEYLPVSSENPFWRYSRSVSKDDPHQGWKIHVSATVLSANPILRAIGPILKNRNALFKAPSTLYRLMKLNSGIVFDYSQIGKFLTIYPQTENDFADLVRTLEPALSKWPLGPGVVFDIRHRSTCIYYRYGTFAFNKSCITTGAGKTLLDSRDHRMLEYAVVHDPLRGAYIGCPPAAVNPFSTKYVIYEAFSQRGKGGVYACVNLNKQSARECIVKEGRLNGETSWSGRDGLYRIKNERRALLSLAKTNVPVPGVYDYFEYSGNGYLVLEKIDGITLDRLMRADLSPASRLELARGICGTIASIHEAGWVWRDCKPQNFIVGSSGVLRPIDFEGACPVNEPDPEPWSTPSFTDRGGVTSSVSTDLYQLGACLFRLLSGSMEPSHRGFISLELYNALLALREPSCTQTSTARLVEDLLGAEQNKFEPLRSDRIEGHIL